ncbi:MAG TPA: ankyrin repeat domain-containing protein [Chthoniobacteraceae bacterium]|nr:ankyrin repeat domain-containing protein [Chthoniobacteraceae bacterium]
MKIAAALVACGSLGAIAFAAPAQSAKQRAIERLDALGVARDGPSLVRVVSAAHKPIIDLLFTAGVNVNALDQRGRSALIAAALARDWSTAHRLIDAGAEVNHADDTGFTPLMGAALGGHLPTAQELLSRGAEPGASDRGGHTALHYAIRARQLPLVDRLLQPNLPFPPACCDGEDLLDHALETHDEPIIDSVLARTPPLPEWSDAACDALNGALEGGNLRIAKALISKHCTPPAPAPGAQPFVAYAIARDDLMLLQTLLDCGADPNVTLDAQEDSDFRTIISKSAVRYYLDKTPGITPLMVAAGCGRTDHVRLLLDHGANRTQFTKGHMQLLALYFAAWAECPEAVQLLVGGTPPSRDELRVEVNLSHQRATLLKDGAPIFSTEISSGKSEKPTPIGEFVITDKQLEHHSTLYHNASMPFFMRLSCRDFGMHEGYVTGHPASHGCIRLPGAAARKFYKELPIGTWVSVFR